MTRELSSIEVAVERFLLLDLEKEHAVTKRELMQDPEIAQLKPGAIESLFKNFDLDSDDVITIEEFCDATGTKPSDLKDEQQHYSKTEMPELEEGVRLQRYCMSTPKAIEVANAIARIEDRTSESEGPIEIIKFLDRHYGPGWHCFRIQGTYHGNYKHEIFMSLQFEYKNWRYVVWRTPK